MIGRDRLAVVNRTLLALLGVVLLAAGAFVLLTTYRVLHWVAPGTLLVATGWHPVSWVPYVVVVVAIVLGLLCLRWLIAQAGRRPRAGRWQLAPDPDAGVTTLPSDVAVAPIVEEISDHPGVVGAAGWLTGHRGEPHLTLRIRTDHTADLTGLRHDIATQAVPRLCQALDLDTLDVGIQFEPTTTVTRAR